MPRSPQADAPGTQDGGNKMRDRGLFGMFQKPCGGQHVWSRGCAGESERRGGLGVLGFSLREVGALGGVGGRPCSCPAPALRLCSGDHMITTQEAAVQCVLRAPAPVCASRVCVPGACGSL